MPVLLLEVPEAVQGIRTEGRTGRGSLCDKGACPRDQYPEKRKKKDNPDFCLSPGEAVTATPEELHDGHDLLGFAVIMAYYP
jgi:hypothetical protein